MVAILSRPPYCNWSSLTAAQICINWSNYRKTEISAKATNKVVLCALVIGRSVRAMLSDRVIIILLDVSEKMYTEYVKHIREPGDASMQSSPRPSLVQGVSCSLPIQYLDQFLFSGPVNNKLPWNLNQKVRRHNLNVIQHRGRVIPNSNVLI